MVLTSKYAIISTMKDYEAKNKPAFSSKNFFPESYRIDLTNDYTSLEEDTFMKTDNNSIWIIKPTFCNCGRGIKMCQNPKKLKLEFSRYINIVLLITKNKIKTSSSLH